ncbi:receptor-type guanylate cyclase gcy-23-like [Gigantopelta aegis]|uniref:receptor-type guanylate cyclase gcy-23-like n=1 Tax=Gigantopelta aegis TaxID=1735272 RepID=UPI001B88886E|nr:receptor-type guanylate cyclase gcy-23-like [Gigantopelta aegis]
MVPKVVADVLKRNESVVTQNYNSVTILFCDIQGFTKVYAYSYPEKVIQMLNSIYSRFDNIVAKYNTYRVDSIGDIFIIVSGAPEPNGNHAADICNLALDLVTANNELELVYLPGNQLKVRTGIHTGTPIGI